MLVSKNLPEVSQTGNVASNQSTSAFPSEIYAILGGSSYGHVIYIALYRDIHYIAKSIGSPPANERFDYFSNFHEYKY